jgi:Spy/CpxP family protein refolding chaperone
MIRVTAVALGLGMLVVADAAGAAGPSPYAGWQGRTIKALSAEQIDDLMNGRGMELALPAELNGYPGPRHVLDLADELDLTPDQLAQTQRLFEDMRREAINLGERIIEREAALDELFASGSASEASLRDATEALGRLNGRLRAHHLSYHLTMRSVLEQHQIEAYQQLRGYGGLEGAVGHRHGRNQHRGQE